VNFSDRFSEKFSISNRTEIRTVGTTLIVWGRGVYRVLVVKPEGKRPLGRPRYRWEDNIEVSSGKGCGVVDRIELAQDRDRRRTPLNAVINILVP
jgi:hypothetical protein